MFFLNGNRSYTYITTSLNFGLQSSLGGMLFQPTRVVRKTPIHFKYLRGLPANAYGSYRVIARTQAARLRDSMLHESATVLEMWAEEGEQPAASVPQGVEELQYREITPNDFHALGSLDAREVRPQHAINHLRELRNTQGLVEGECGICGDSSDGSKLPLPMLRRLPCCPKIMCDGCWAEVCKHKGGLECPYCRRNLDEVLTSMAEAASFAATRGEQDAEFQASLAIDQAKTIASAAAAAAIDEAAAVAAADAAAATARRQARIEEATLLLEAAPSGVDPVITVLVKLPCGQRLQRAFLVSAAMAQVYHFTDVMKGNELLLQFEDYQLVTIRPRRVCARSDMLKSTGDQTIFYVEEFDRAALANIDGSADGPLAAGRRGIGCAFCRRAGAEDGLAA